MTSLADAYRATRLRFTYRPMPAAVRVAMVVLIVLTLIVGAIAVVMTLIQSAEFAMSADGAKHHVGLAAVLGTLVVSAWFAFFIRQALRMIDGLLQPATAADMQLLHAIDARDPYVHAACADWDRRGLTPYRIDLQPCINHYKRLLGKDADPRLTPRLGTVLDARNGLRLLLGGKALQP